MEIYCSIPNVLFNCNCKGVKSYKCNSLINHLMHNFNEHCIVLVIFFSIVFFLITLLTCTLMSVESNDKYAGLYFIFIFISPF